MKDRLAEIYKLAGFKTKVAKELMHTAHKCIEAAYLWENDKVRKECIKAKLDPAVSDKTEYAIEDVYQCMHSIKNLLDKEVEYVSVLAEKNIGDPKWKEYKKIADKFN